jgi:predicted RNase H-like nuclease (RuvC/YqgF family)
MSFDLARLAARLTEIGRARATLTPAEKATRYDADVGDLLEAVTALSQLQQSAAVYGRAQATLQKQQLQNVERSQTQVGDLFQSVLRLDARAKELEAERDRLQAENDALRAQNARASRKLS